jgi:hypothetical protein
VVAYDAEDVASDPAQISLQVVSAVAEATAVESPDATETPVPDVTGEGGCTLNGSFVADVSIPDGTEMAPGTAFSKVWRVKNSGTCDWGAGFELIFASGAQMGGPSAIALPQVAAGANTDVSVDLVAPATPGEYKGVWRLRSEDGTVFGSSLIVVVVVPEPATDTPEPTFTHTPTLTPTNDIVVPPLITMIVPDLTLIPLAPQTQQALNQISVPANSTGNAAVACPEGSVVTGGGYAAGSDVFVYTHSKSDNGWRVYAKNNSGSSQLLNVYAICLLGSGGSTSQVLAQVSTAAGQIGHAVANCPAGSVVTGGGYASRADESLYVYNSSRSGNGWEVYAQNTAGSSQPLNAYAICLADTDATVDVTFEQSTINAGDTGKTEATCASGVVTGGGFAGSTDLFFYNTSMTSSAQGWVTYALNKVGSGKLLNTYVVCLSFP